MKQKKRKEWIRVGVRTLVADPESGPIESRVSYPVSLNELGLIPIQDAVAMIFPLELEPPPREIATDDGCRMIDEGKARSVESHAFDFVHVGPFFP